MADPLSPTSAWGFTASWFTPASLFLLLNLVIGTIALTSRFSSNKRPREENRPVTRSPSLIERVKSINFSFHKYSPFDSETTTDYVENAESVSTATGVDPPPLQRAPSLLDRLKSVNFSSFYASEPETEPDGESEPDTHQDSGSEVDHQVKRSKTEPTVGLQRKASEKLKKSASEKAVSVEEEDGERVEGRRPQTTRIEKTVSIGDEGVDAKADDFINRFKQQLRLQRLDSLLRYRDMLKGK